MTTDLFVIIFNPFTKEMNLLYILKPSSKNCLFAWQMFKKIKMQRFSDYILNTQIHAHADDWVI